MKLELCGFVHHDILKAYTDGNIPRYLVCGVDTYINPETAGDQDYDVENPFSMEREMFFSSRFFRLIDLENPDEYQPFSNVPELQRHMKDLKIKSANFLSGDTIEQNDTDTIYVLTPLDYLDFFALMDGKNVDSYFGMGIPNLPRHLRLFHDQGIKITSVSPLEGRLGNWDVSSRGSIIAVETPGDFCGGIPLDAAIELHERPPLHKLGANLGGFIRPNGYTPAKDPRFVALPDEDGFKQIARDGMSIPEIRTIAQQASLPLFVGAYHIDSSKAFEAWAQVAKKFI